MDAWQWNISSSINNAQENAGKVAGYVGGQAVAARWRSLIDYMRANMGETDPAARQAIDNKWRAEYSAISADTNAIIMAGVMAQSAAVIASQPVAVQSTLTNIQAAAMGISAPAASVTEHAQPKPLLIEHPLAASIGAEAAMPAATQVAASGNAQPGQQGGGLTLAVILAIVAKLAFF